MSTCATKWIMNAGCWSRAVCSAGGSAGRRPSAMFFRVCPGATSQDGKVEHLWSLMVSSSHDGDRMPHQTLYRTLSAAKRAAADYVRGFRR
jgi:hypothetical protein